MPERNEGPTEINLSKKTIDAKVEDNTETNAENLKAMNALKEAYPNAFNSSTLQDGTPLLITRDSGLVNEPTARGIKFIKEKDHKTTTTNFIISPSGIAEVILSDGREMNLDKSGRFKVSCEKVFNPDSDGKRYVSIIDNHPYQGGSDQNFSVTSLENFSDLIEERVKSIKAILTAANEKHKPKIDRVIEKLKP